VSVSVYFVHSRDWCAHKIGYSATPERRFSALQTAFPFRLELEQVWECPEPRVLEQRLHGFLSEYRIRGEWFRDGAVYDLLAELREIGVAHPGLPMYERYNLYANRLAAEAFVCG
jgi:hypothetical protein